MARKYSAKIILFGEYSVILDGLSLAIPFPAYSGEWLHSNQNAHLDQMLAFIDYVAEQDSKSYRLEAFKVDIQSGLSFVSDIPLGAGLGSSGAFVAAFYDRYCLQQKEDLPSLQKELAALESFFHGRSSGLDPLISLLRKGILSKKNDTHEALTKEDLSHGLRNLFLFDSKVKRQSSGLVKAFLSKMESPHYKSMISDGYSHLVSSCIEAIKEQKPLDSAFKKLSQFQFHYLSEMIPQTVREVWMDGLKSNDYYLKLCGAGGGGYFLGYTPNRALTTISNSALLRL